MGVTRIIAMVFYGAAALYILACVDRWYRIVRFSGVPSVKTMRRMWDIYALRTPRTQAASRQIHMREVACTSLVVSAVSGLLWFLTRSELFLGLAFYMVAHIIGTAARHGMPPGILLLGSSGELAEHLQLSLREAAGYPYVAALLEGHSRFSDIDWSRFADDAQLHEGSLRTAQNGTWRGAVDALIDIAPIAVVDTRKVSPGLAEEIELIAGRPNMEKFFFVAEAKDNRLGIGSDMPWKTIGQRVPESSVVTETELLAWIHEAARHPKTLRRRFHFK